MRRRLADALAEDIADGADLDFRRAPSPRHASAAAWLQRIARARPTPLSSARTDHGWLHPLGSFLAAGAMVQATITILVLASLAELPAGGRVPRELQLITLLVSATSAALLMGIGYQEPAARALAITLFGLAGAFSTAFAAVAANWLPEAVEPWRRGMVELPFELALVAGAWLFVSVFPRVESGTKVQTSIEYCCRGVALILAILFTVNLSLAILGRSGTSAWSGIAKAIDRHTTGSWFWSVYFTALIPAAFLGLAKLRLGYGSNRKQVRQFLFALSFGFGPIVLVAVITALSRAGAALLRTDALFPIVTAAIFAGLWSLPLTTGAAVLRRGFLPVRILVHRTLQYIVATSTLSVLTATPAAIALVLLVAGPHRTVAEFLNQGGSLWLTLTIGSVGLMLVRQRLHSAIDRVFNRSNVDARQLITEIGALSRRKLGPRNAADVLLAGIDRAFRPSSAGLLFADQSGTLRPLAGEAAPIPADSALLLVLGAGPGAISFEPSSPDRISPLLPADEVAGLTLSGCRIIVPLLADGEILIGALVLGGRASQAEYSPDDLATLEAICATAAPVLASRMRASGDAGPSSESIPGTECEACGRLFNYQERACACGQRLVGSMLPRRVAGRYALHRRLGSGGMGVVYEALDEQLQRQVALKTLPEVGVDETEQLRQEARMMTRFQHPGLAQVLGFETVGPLPILVVEHLAGGTLADRLVSSRMALDQVLQMGIQAASALACLHDNGVLHRDLKPTNVGFTAAGRVKLLDFGVAIPLADAAAVAPAGTMRYVAPEVLNGGPPNALCDLWSLGVVLRDALEASVPHVGDVGEVGLRLAAVADRLLRIDPGARFASATELLQALQKIEEDTHERSTR